jgi:predicted nucleotidyltransferase
MDLKSKISTNKIVSLLVDKYQPGKVILFGSAAIGKADQESDIDLVVIKKTPKRFYDRIGDVLNILWSGEETPKVGVDILVYTPEEFQLMSKDNYFVRDEILGKGRTVYERPAD